MIKTEFGEVMGKDIAIYFDGGRMNFLHHLTLLSAVRRGHSVTVYAQGPSENIPDCVKVESVFAAVESSLISAACWQDASRKRAAAFQFELLAALDGVITMGFDHVLTSSGPLLPQDGQLFGWQSDDLIGTGILALPAKSNALAALLDATRHGSTAEAWGSQLLTNALRQDGGLAKARPRDDFYGLEPANVLLTLKKYKEVKSQIPSGSALPVYHPYLLPEMQRDFHGIPRYWSWLGSLLRENGVTVRNALAFPGQSLPDRVWNNETRDYTCVDWSPSAILSSAFSGATSKRDGLPSVSATPSVTRKAAPVVEVVTRPAPQTLAPKVVAPQPPLAPQTGNVSDQNPLKVMIVTTMRNEAPFILEWVAYHRAIGITDFVVYTNDCDDGTVELLDALADRGLITARIDNPFREQKKAPDWQRAALWHLQNSDLMDGVDWLIPMDVDEYINIHVGQGRFADLVHAVPDAHMISMIWRLFGNSSVNEFEDRFVTEQFELAALDNCARPALAWGFKTAFQPQKVGGLWSVHRPKKIEDQKDSLNWYYGTGKKIEDAFFEKGWRADRKSAGYDLVTLNHYSLRSSESYLIKKHRGRVNHMKEDQDISYFFRMNHNVAPERSIQTKLPQAKALFNQYLEDETLRALHENGVAQSRARIKNLKADPEYRSLYDTVTSQLMEIYSRLTPHFGNWIFAVGPKCIPKEYEAWALDRFEKDPGASHDTAPAPPGMQSSGTILPNPKYLEELNENRIGNLGKVKPLGGEIFQR